MSEYRILHPHTFQSLVDFKETCLRLYSLVEGKGGSPYFGFTHVRMKDILDIDEIRRHIPKMTIHYDWGEEILIVKFMVGVTHNLCASMFRRYFERSVPGDDFLDSFLPLKSSRFIGPQRMKEGDEAYKPTSRHLERDWPSIVIEVDVSERFDTITTRCSILVGIF